MNLIFPAIISFILTAISVPFTITLAKKAKLIDNPKIRPHPAHTQQRIVPRAGGLAIFLGLAITTLLFMPLGKTVTAILISTLLLLIVGLFDDKYHNFSPYLRLLAQFIAAAIIVLGGVSVKFITNPFGGIIFFESIPLLPQILTLIWIVWVMNMINWSKGVDGQMPGIITVAAIILGLLSLKLNISNDPGQIMVAKLSFITAASAFAFLLFNWHPAKIFPGFSGSAVSGFMIAVLAILSGGKLATAGLVLLIPATDFAYTFFRRILEGKSPVWGDRGHLHHKMLKAGLSHQQIALFYILGSAILGAAALSLSSQGKLFAAILVGIVIFGGILWLHFFGELQKRPAPDNG
ncbi:undecaprenyl/decaprenyl-phosphate alpha-N-acetylglucosaminyl 1-phosphate transferase [Candidatus Daviesbacteria bacterium]|nr:undecaprenyl/decaprenyl-phosphate alpha-N-acetylglucosaminyl 1-phosphate transferase [Candidatus Daviesbacteria bacterium]